ncbi:MAG: adenylate/guanylate cyclase domain-containing protein [Leptospira sp.]|nr:adenylate/guanylate cyclase domain-containing protein [Leptospira sp.]
MSEQSPTSLEEFLTVYSWSESHLNFHQPLDYFWEFHLNASIEELWDILIDTSSFNERMGLPPMQYEERDGKLHGRSKNAGFQLEWEEVPWEWEYCKTLNNARIYSKGFATYVRTRYIFNPVSKNETRLYVYFGWIPRNWLGKIVLQIGMKKILKDYQRVLKAIVDEIQAKKHHNNGMSVNSFSSKSNSQQLPIGKYSASIQEIRKKLILDGNDANLVDRMIRKVLMDSENDLFRIQVKKIAQEWNKDYQEILKLALYGCKHGLFTLSWDIVCPHCRGVRKELKNLGDIPSDANCDVCDIDFSTSSLNAIEITFHIHPSIRQVQKRFFCAAEPATKKHIYFQKYLEPNSIYDANLTLNDGIYRIRSGNDKSYGLLEINDIETESEDILKSRSELKIELETSKNLDIKYSSHDLHFQIKNSNDYLTPFIIESREEDQYALRPGDLLNFREFRNLFSEEYIESGITLDIGVQTILFTDIVGSTKLYHNHGDSKAFSEVRKHFVEIYRVMEENDGVVVKTIGDSVMASFSDQVNAINAAMESQEFFQSKESSDLLKIRISIHYGNCLAVNFNNGIDYFGNTVNFASKLQRFAYAGDIVISEDLFELKSIKKKLLEIQKSYKIKRLQFQEKWKGDSIQKAYKIHIPPG